MIVKCPACKTDWECDPAGTYRCEKCGAEFSVAADGSTTLADADATVIDPERTVPWPKPDPDDDETKLVTTDDDPTILPRPEESAEDTISVTNPDEAAIPGKDGFDPDRTMENRYVRRERGELQIGDTVLGRYELLEKLGSGAMGVVFKCRDRISQVEYAIKMVPPELARDAEAMDAVRTNFQLVHNLKHPNIASTDFLERDEYGAYFLIMEFAPGISLTQWIKNKWQTGRPELAEVVEIDRLAPPPQRPPRAPPSLRRRRARRDGPARGRQLARAAAQRERG